MSKVSMIAGGRGLPDRSWRGEVDYHLDRARQERRLAAVSGSGEVAGAHQVLANRHEALALCANEVRNMPDAAPARLPARRELRAVIEKLTVPLPEDELQG